MNNNGHSKTDKRYYVSIEEVDDLLLNARGDKNYVKCFRDYWPVVGKGTALFFCDLMDRGRMHLKRFKKFAKVGRRYRLMTPDRYFRCSMKYLENAGWSAKEQEIHMVKLKKKGFIKSRRSGPSGSRWVKLEMTAIERAADEAAFPD